MIENICNDEHDDKTTTNDGRQIESSNWNVFRDYLLNISQPCNAMLLMCRYALETYKCMEIFDTVLSDEGEKKMPIPICKPYWTVQFEFQVIFN